MRRWIRQGRANFILDNLLAADSISNLLKFSGAFGSRQVSSVYARLMSATRLSGLHV